MPSNPVRRKKTEITREEYDAIAKQGFKQGLNGILYTEVKLRGGTWHRPVAGMIDGKYYKVEDVTQ